MKSIVTTCYQYYLQTSKRNVRERKWANILFYWGLCLHYFLSMCSLFSLIISEPSWYCMMWSQKSFTKPAHSHTSHVAYKSSVDSHTTSHDLLQILRAHPSYLHTCGRRSKTLFRSTFLEVLAENGWEHWGHLSSVMKPRVRSCRDALGNAMCWNKKDSRFQILVLPGLFSTSRDLYCPVYIRHTM